MLNCSLKYLVFIILSYCSLLQAQDSALYNFKTYGDLKIESIATKKLVLIDSVFSMIPLANDDLFYMNTNLSINRQSIEIKTEGFYKISTYYDTMHVLAKKKYQYRCLKRKKQGKSMQFQLLPLGSYFYVLYNYSGRKAEDTYVLNFEKIQMPLGTFGASCAIADSASSYLFIFTNCSRPEFYTKAPKGEQPPYTFGDYKSIVILDEKSKPCALITIHKNLYDAHIAIINEQGFYESKMIINWKKVKEYTLNEWAIILKNMPEPDETSKSLGRKMYKIDWQSWGEAYRYQIHWDKDK